MKMDVNSTSIPDRLSRVVTACGGDFGTNTQERNDSVAALLEIIPYVVLAPDFAETLKRVRAKVDEEVAARIAALEAQLAEATRVDATWQARPDSTCQNLIWLDSDSNAKTALGCAVTDAPMVAELRRLLGMIAAATLAEAALVGCKATLEVACESTANTTLDKLLRDQYAVAAAALSALRKEIA